MLGEIGQDHVGRDRRHAVEPRLSELALDVVFLREAEATMRLHSHVGGGPGRIGGEQLGHVGLGPDLPAFFVFARGLADH